MFKIVTESYEFDLSKMHDWALVMLARECEFEPAAADLVERHLPWIKPLVARLCRRKGLCAHEQIEDAQQEAVLAIEEAIEHYDVDQVEMPHGCSFRTFAERVVRDRFKDFAKRERRAKARSRVSLEAAMEKGDRSAGKTGFGARVLQALASTRDDPVLATERRDASERLRRAILKLVDELRVVIEGILAGQSLNAIAVKLELNYHAVWRRREKAFGQLALLLAEA